MFLFTFILNNLSFEGKRNSCGNIIKYPLQTYGDCQGPNTKYPISKHNTEILICYYNICKLKTQSYR